jgi:hypothetical protein
MRHGDENAVQVLDAVEPLKDRREVRFRNVERKHYPIEAGIGHFLGNQGWPNDLCDRIADQEVSASAAVDGEFHGYLFLCLAINGRRSFGTG